MPSKHDTIVDDVYHGAFKAVGEIGESIMEFFDPPPKPETPEERIASALEEIAKRDRP